MSASTGANKYDRATLENFINQYLEALAKNDPSGLPLADKVVYVENNQVVKFGEGIWKTITGLGVYRHYFADLLTGQTAVISVVEENGKKIILNLRLKITDGKISEIENLVCRDYRGAQNYENRGQPPAIFLQTVPEERRKPRERLIVPPNQYFSGMEHNDPKGDYSFFADSCNRMENGLVTTNAPAAEYGHSTDKVFVTMTCREQFETGFLGFVTRIRDRRFFVIDEERQSVISFAYFDHDGTVRQIEMPNNRTFPIPPFFSTPRTLQVCESFRVENDQLQFIEVNLTELPYGTRPIWDTEKDNWLRKSASVNKDADKTADSTMSRGQLTAIVDRFIEALLSRDLKPKGIAESCKYTENGQLLNIGDGLWGTASKISEHKIVFADPETGSAVFMGCITEYDVDACLTARLKVRNGEIVEIETLLMRHEYDDARMGTLTLMAPRLQGIFKPGDCDDLPGIFGQALQPDERTDAKTMKAAVQEKLGSVREQHVLLTDVEYGLLLSLTFTDVPNTNTSPVDPASTGPYSVLGVQLHKFKGGKIVAAKSMIMAALYKMNRGW